MHESKEKCRYLSRNPVFHSLVSIVFFAACNRHFEFSLTENPLILHMSPRHPSQTKWRTVYRNILTTNLRCNGRSAKSMVTGDQLKKIAIYGAAISCLGAAFCHHRIQGMYFNKFEKKSCLVNFYQLAFFKEYFYC